MPEGMEATVVAVNESEMNDVTYNGQYQLTTNKSDFVFTSAAGNQIVNIFTDYTGAPGVAGSAGWKIASVTSTGGWITAPAVGATGAANVTTPTTITCTANGGSTPRKGTFVITAGNLRKTINVLQLPAAGNITDQIIPNSYVGAFWKANQKGERLIRIARPTNATADGDWTATVIAGGDWIILDKTMTSDPNVGWRAGAVEASVANGNDAGFDSQYAVRSNLTSVSGTLRPSTDPNYQNGDDYIYFRMGLNSQYVPTAAAPARYGVVLLTYNNNTKPQRIWIRQGDNADYLMRPGDLNGSNAAVADGRSYARKFSPYNLKDPGNGAPTSVSETGLPVNGGWFVDYPSQGGYLFMYNYNTVAYNPVAPATIGGWASTLNGADALWNAANSETCPQDYRRPQDGAPTTNNTTGAIAGSEMRQSLWLTPPNGFNNVSAGNNVLGYYADGFFDRRAIGTSPGTPSSGNSAVSAANNNVAYWGQLFYNKNNYASLFFPCAGSRQSGLIGAGTTGYYWTSTPGSTTNSLYMITGANSWILSDRRANINSVRCVLDPFSIPPDKVTTPPDQITDSNSGVVNQYVGAFWKANQTGERLIRIVATAASGYGDWNAQVIVGDDWIVLDKAPTSDPLVNWTTVQEPTMSGNDTGFDATYKLPATATWWVKGNASASVPIYFRIGLKSTISPTDHRYGIVLLTYGTPAKTQRIWIRQGEEADYLMRDSDPVSSGGLTSRTVCRQFSPYNLTVKNKANFNTAIYGTAATPDFAVNPSAFTDYPTQAGAYFMWASPITTRFALDPFTVGNIFPSLENDYWPTPFWDDIGATNETCPPGYRRPTDGTTNSYDNTSTMTASEMRQSLYEQPPTGRNDDRTNSVYGYYADGFFDRRAITDGVTATTDLFPATNCSVSISNSSVAYIGYVFFNKNSYASIFFPITGYRYNRLSSTGGYGYYWSSTLSGTSATGWALYLNNGWVRQNDTSKSNYAYPIRCVRP